MIEQAFDRNQLRRYVAAVRDRLDAPELQRAAEAAATHAGGDGSAADRLRARIPEVSDAVASSGQANSDKVPFTARDPFHSLVQSSIESGLRARGVVGTDAPPHRDLLHTIIHTVESLLDPVRFGPEDPGWVTEIAGAVLDRLGRGNHAFNPEPATLQISDGARIVIVGDWGSGLPRARAVAGFMAEEVAEALSQGRQAHVIHLGDVYYSGLPEEVDRHVLGPGLWPVSTDQAAAGVSSWSLNGNHDMYGGGFGYFDRLLADPRFKAQRSPDGKTTSYFRITSPSWNIVGLDTAWDTDVFSQGQQGVLADPQAAFVAKTAADAERKLMLLSHHQLLSVYSPGDLGQVLGPKLRPVLDGGRLTAWLWGHEHRCMGFTAHDGVGTPRCIGHGGVPVLAEHAAGDPVPPPGIWEERGYLEFDGDHWARFGFAVLDFAGDHIDVRYRDDQGTQTRTEQIA